jgi:hypothetical protein
MHTVLGAVHGKGAAAQPGHQVGAHGVGALSCNEQRVRWVDERIQYRKRALPRGRQT